MGEGKSYLNEHYIKLGFVPQKEIIFNRFLPYADKLDSESTRLFADIKGNLGRSMMLREYRPGFGVWISRLNKYLRVYGLKFSKEDHIALIKLLMEALLIPNLEPSRVYKIGNALSLLLKKTYLITSDELEIPWRPLHDLRERITARNETNLGMFRYFATLEASITCLIDDCKLYFPITATQEILTLWRPRLCPFNPTEMCDAVESLLLFLPMKMKPEHASKGHKLWLPEIMDLWETCHNSPLWENNLMWMIARAAENNIGYLDWEPYVPKMFTRFLRSLDLPVSYKGLQNGKTSKVDVGPIALWIVSVLGHGSSAIRYLRQLIDTVESYFYHANQGRWVSKLKSLLRKLATNFIARLHKERYQKDVWTNTIPDDYALTEDDITEFVRALEPAVKHSVYGSTMDVIAGLQSLAILRPNIIIPIVLDKLYMTLDSLTEPHRLTAAMQCLSSMGRPLVEGAKNGYPEGPTHVIPLLLALLPGIDPNDIRKCLVTFQFIATFASLIPMIDCSNASDFHEDLTEEEHMLSEATAQLEDFVLQFMDRVFTIIESSAMESTRLEHADTEKKSKLESVAENALASICGSLLMQTSPAIFKSALHKLDTFVSERILEIKVSGPLVAVMVRSFAKVNAEEVCKCFIPRLCENILAALKDVEKTEENLDNEILFHLLILSEIVHTSGRALLPYEDILMAVLDKTLWLTCRQAAFSAHNLLGRALAALSNIGLIEYRSTSISFDTPIKDFLPIREWGKPGDLLDLDVKFFIPSEAEIACIQRFVWRYLPLELRRLELHIAGNGAQITLADGSTTTSSDSIHNVELEREELHRSLGVILALLHCKTVLPLWDEPPISLLETKVDLAPMELEIGFPRQISMPDGSNIRRTVAETMGRLQDKILSSAEGDTKSLFHLIAIWNTLLLNKSNGDRGFEAHWKNYHNVKRMVEDKLRGGKKHLRCLLVDRVMLQHELRIEASVHQLTKTHADIFHRLLQLATSSYSEVRAQGQNKLHYAIGHFTYSYTILVPELKSILQLDSNLNHEKFKGALYMLMGPKTVPLMARHDWWLVNQIWPTLVNSNLSEKPSVIGLLDSLVETVHKHFPTITIELKIPDTSVECARTMWNNYPVPSQEIPQEDEIQEGLIHLQKTGENNLRVYNSTMNELMNSIESGKLHWRYNYMAYNFLRDLVHPDVKYNARIVRCFLNTLIHDSIDLRKLMVRTTIFILKQHKRPHKKILVDPIGLSCRCVPVMKPGDRPDNKWLQYNSATRPMTSEEWDKPRYLHKEYHGYYTWPSKVEMYAPSCDQPPLDRDIYDLSNEELEVFTFFNSEQNIKKLIDYLSMEEKKGKDKFSGFRFILFKNLFRNHGDAFLPIFLPHLQRLVVAKQEQNQRCAAEIIAALIRGCKHWPFDKVANLWVHLGPLIKTALSNMTVETVHDWGICFATASEGRDPNRNHWLFEILMEDPLRDEASFIECGRLFALQGALNQQEWRMAELFHRLWEYFKNYLAHPFQNVRERLSSVLTNITETDVVFPGGNRTISPRIEQIVDEVEPKLNILYQSGLKDFNHVLGRPLGNGDSSSKTNVAAHERTTQSLTIIDNVKLSDSDKESSLRLMKTVFKWIVSVLSRMQYSSLLPFYKIFGLACLLQSHENDEEVAKACVHLLAMLSQALHLPEEVPHVLKHIRAIAEPCPSWSARVAVTRFLQSFVFHNMALIISDQVQVIEIERIILLLLRDEALEVRCMAAQVLSGFLHCNFIPNPDQLLNDFKVKAQTGLRKHSKMNQTTCQANRSAAVPEQAGSNNTQVEAIRQRHSAVLGLCAFIDAHPYDVPAFIPDVFLALGQHLNDPQPIPTTIRKTLGDFKRTHHENWETHKLQFTEEQLVVLNDLSVPPSYYA